MPDVALKVAGKAYAGWKTVRVTRGIESVAGRFDLSVSDRWSPGAAPWPIVRGDECTVTIGRVPVIVGYVDRTSPSFDADSHELAVSGRDRTGDLVDSSAIPKAWEFKSTPVATVAQRLASEFGIAVTLAPGVTPPKPAAKITVNPGDTAWEVIERACRTAGLLAAADGAGGLVLMRPGALRAHTALVEGENILAGSGTFDATDRFAEYIALGQHAGGDALFGPPARAVRSVARDANVRPARRLLIRPEGNVTPAQAQRRCEWEATVRAARGDSVTVTVAGWTQGDGSLWPVNALVRVRSPFLGVDGELLITQTDFSQDDTRGTLTTLTLRHADAFKPEPVIPKRGKGGTNSYADLLG